MPDALDEAGGEEDVGANEALRGVGGDEEFVEELRSDVSGGLELPRYSGSTPTPDAVAPGTENRALAPPPPAYLAFPSPTSLLAANP